MNYFLTEGQLAILQRVMQRLYEDRRLNDDQRRDLANTLHAVLGSIALQEFHEEDIAS